MTAKNQFIFEREDDETLKVFLNGTEVGSANHDSDGWAGMESLESLARGIAKVLHIPVLEI
jgi:hypothetical protein